MIRTPDGIYIQKVRGLDASADSTVKQIGSVILYDTPRDTISLQHQEEHLNTLTDYLNSIKKDINNLKDVDSLKETKIIRYPGYSRKEKRTFKLNIEDLRYPTISNRKGFSKNENG
jgi:hypothetical protein